jgi:hypothetical protein
VFNACATPAKLANNTITLTKTFLIKLRITFASSKFEYRYRTKVCLFISVALLSVTAQHLRW